MKLCLKRPTVMQVSSGRDLDAVALAEAATHGLSGAALTDSGS